MVICYITKENKVSWTHNYKDIESFSKENPDTLIEWVFNEKDDLLNLIVFDEVRQLSVINCLNSEVLFQKTGKMSIEVDFAGGQLELIVEDLQKRKGDTDVRKERSSTNDS